MHRSRKAAYYSRNDSFSRSYNAECAEDEGRLPRTRAAAYLGLSTAAFDAGCRAAGYVATEWHHVGKYASRIDYYDCEELASQPEFWAGAAAAYKSAKKRAEVLATTQRWAEAERQARVEEFRQQLIRQRDCTRRVRRHSALSRWQDRCAKVRISSDIPIGDLASFAAAVGERQRRDAERAELGAQRLREADELQALLAECFTPTTDDLGRPAFTLDGNLHVRPHAGGVNIWHRKGGENHRSITAARALEVLRNKLAKVAHA